MISFLVRTAECSFKRTHRINIITTWIHKNADKPEAYRFRFEIFVFRSFSVGVFCINATNQICKQCEFNNVRVLHRHTSSTLFHMCCIHFILTLRHSAFILYSIPMLMLPSFSNVFVVVSKRIFCQCEHLMDELVNWSNFSINVDNILAILLNFFFWLIIIQKATDEKINCIPFEMCFSSNWIKYLSDDFFPALFFVSWFGK